MSPPPPTSTLFPYTTLFRSIFVAARTVMLPTPIKMAHPASIIPRPFNASLIVSIVVDFEGLRGLRGPDLEVDRLRAKRSEEHTSELQSRFDLVCRLLLEKKK